MTKPLYKVRPFRDLREMMNMSAELFGDRYAFEVKRDNGEHYFITFRDYRTEIDALGAALFDMGLSGTRLAIAADNCYEWCLSYMTTVIGGCVVVPIDKELGQNDIHGILQKSQAKLLFCDAKLLQRLDREQFRDVILVCFKQKEDADGALSFDKLVQKGRRLLAAGSEAYKNAEIDPEKMCTLLFTSGTTGTSKGVMLCQRNFCQDILHTMEVVKIRPEDCGLSILPLHHTYESTVIMMCAPYSGAKVTFCDGFKYALRNMKEFSPSVFVSVPLILETVHRRLMKAIKDKPHGEFKFKLGSALCKAGAKVGIDLKKVFFKEIQEAFGGRMRLVICGGAPIDPQILKDFDAFGIQIIFGYGLTECSPLIIINNDRLHLADSSIGEPLPSVEAKIDNPNETGVGEICVRGPMVMLGYYENEEATREVIDEDGFFHTGDLGRVDEKNHFYVCGRSKNVIVTDNGKNIFPEELEYHLGLHEVVSDSLVYGGKDKKGKLAVMAKIFPNYAAIRERLGKKEVTDEEVEAVIREAVDRTNRSVPGFKRITQFSIRKTEFIKTTTAKIQRFRKENLQDE